MTTKSGSECKGSSCKVDAEVSDNKEGNSDIHPGIALRIDQLLVKKAQVTLIITCVLL